MRSVPYALTIPAMHAPTLKDAVEDARGVIAMYGLDSLPDDDCIPAVR